MTLDFPEPRARQCIMSNRVVRNALMARHSLRSSFNRRADRILFSGSCRTTTSLLWHNHRNELAFFFEHADFANRGLLGIGRFDIFGLNLLPALGLNQRRNAAKDVKTTVVIEVTHIAAPKPSILGKDLVGFVREIPVT